MSKLVIVLGDQLNKNISSLSDFNKESDQVLMAEIYQEAKYANHHKKKIAFLFSAMRHFNNELLEDEFPVYYHCYQNDDSISFESLIKELISFNKNINQLVERIAMKFLFRVLISLLLLPNCWAKINILHLAGKEDLALKARKIFVERHFIPFELISIYEVSECNPLDNRFLELCINKKGRPNFDIFIYQRRHF